MLLRVEVEGRAWLADVGFGDGLLQPMPLAPGQVVRQFAQTYRVMEEEGVWVLQSLRGDGWQDFYAFTLEPQVPVDYEVANYYTSTHPDSVFRRLITVQRPTPEARYVLWNRELTVTRGASAEKRVVADDDDLLGVLAGHFGLEFPPGTRFPTAG
jgi:N-hydroxyarylamine O-acetyltransferase